MKGHLAEDFRKIFRAVQIISPMSFSLAGWAFGPLPSESQDSVPVVGYLTRQLYRQCYCRPFDGVLTDRPFFYEPDDDFVAGLSKSNVGRERLDRGWRIERLLPTGHIIVRKSGYVRIVVAEELAQEDGAALGEGAFVSLICPRESKVTHPGFYFIYGEAVTDQQDDASLVRFYWNVRAAGAQDLVRHLTRRLNRFQIPFRLKCLNNPAAYERADAAVLYLNRRFFRLASEILADVHREMEEHLEPYTPLFSKPLAAGLGLAEEPGNGESFGQQRCRILAEGIWQAHERNLHNEEQLFEEVARQFESKGLSLDAPYLNPGSVDEYDFPSRGAEAGE